MFKIMNLMMEHGADINDYFDWNELSPDADLELYDLSQQQESEKRVNTFYRGTLLHYAFLKKLPDVVNFCLVAGANPLLPLFELGTTILR
jgi:hypothetical protein